MSLKYLAIDKDEKLHEKESEFWLSRNIPSIRVSSMSEGIEKAMTNNFLFIVINASNINYTPTLKILRNATNDPILIATNSYNMQEHGIARGLGADFFGEMSDNTEDNYKSVMATISSLSERINKSKPLLEIMSHGDLLLVKDYHKAFVKDIEIFLTKIEMKIFYLLMANHGCTLEHEQICKKIYDSEYTETSHSNLYSLIRRLRGKLWDVSSINYIETVKDIGYRLITKSDYSYSFN